MEKIFNPYDKESMKIAMLKHEETFRYQVYELHRLYQIQKVLMKNIAEEKRQESHQPSKGNNAEECIAESGELVIEDETELELTLGPSCYNRRRKASEVSDSALSFSSSSSDSNHIKKNIPGNHQHQINPGFLGELQNGINDPDQFRQDRLKNPPWLCQFFSLNMT